MRTAPHPVLRAAPVLLGGAFLAASPGCSSASYDIRFDMPPHTRASITPDGGAPVVEVTNGGPGAVQVRWDDGISNASLRGGAISRTTRSGERVALETADEPADLRVRVKEATGVTLEGPSPAH